MFSVMILCAFYACKQHQVRQIPISDFFKNPEASVFKLSPDGKYIAYLKSYKGRQNLFIKSLADGNERRATSFTDYSVRDYSWTYSDQVVFIQDIISLDKYSMFALDASTLETRNVLSLEKGRIRLLNNRNKKEPAT